MGGPIIEMEDVRFAYEGGSFELSVPSLSIERGGSAACIGTSGSGKTTLIGLMTGILTPDGGRVTLDGEHVSSMPDAQRRALRASRVGLVFQEFELLDYLSALDNVLLPYHISPALKLTDDVRDRARELGGQCGIGHTLGRKPRRLSQGERQRVAICRALIAEPALLVCDEPTGSLDPRTSASVLDLLFEQASARGATLLVVTHDHAPLDRFDRVIDMADLAQAGAPS